MFKYLHKNRKLLFINTLKSHKKKKKMKVKFIKHMFFVNSLHFYSKISILKMFYFLPNFKILFNISLLLKSIYYKIE